MLAPAMVAPALFTPAAAQQALGRLPPHLGARPQDRGTTGLSLGARPVGGLHGSWRHEDGHWDRGPEMHGWNLWR